MKKVLIAAVAVLVILLGIILVDAIVSKKNDVSVNTDGNVLQTEATDVSGNENDTQPDVQQSEDTDDEQQTENKDDNGNTQQITIKDMDAYNQQSEIKEIPTKDAHVSVQFTMPLYYLEEKYRNDLDLFCKENNYEACTIDETAQTFTVTMNSLVHDMMLINVGIQVIKNMANNIESEKYPFFKELNKYNDDFSEITILVDKAGYNASTTDKEGFMAFIAGCGIYYQLYTEKNEYSCKVVIQDKESGEILDAKSFEQNNSGVVS